ncbi:MAG: heavy-metal-associated domain-containing protein [Tissierellia bacterium]|mgnify:CR=1 FL=1|jgi:copper chaperone CopZ|nr:heavy-metal-associated domain-containing protein [Tissierellia bacterium]
MQEYKVSGMSCGHCEDTVRNIAIKHGAGANAEVDRVSGTVRFTADDRFDNDKFMEAVEDAGYEIEEVSALQTVADQATRNSW